MYAYRISLAKIRPMMSELYQIYEPAVYTSFYVTICMPNVKQNHKGEASIQTVPD